MKSGLLSLLAALAFLGTLATTRADSDITFKDFYDALSPDGDWVEVEDYGYCWRPFVDDRWSPYTDGQWVYTDAGYTWFSNEPWGWAVYHYGRWTKVKNWGWVWVPGYDWGPAWVSWRSNDDYIGWAPLPPEATWDPGVGFTSYVDIDYGIGPDWYSFCPVTYFCAPRLRTVCLPWRNNVTIIANTVNITRIRNVNNVIIFNDGPDINIINRRADTPLRRVRLEREGNVNVAELRAGRIRSRIEGDTLKVPAPKVHRQENRPNQIAGRAGAKQINRGWEAAEKNPQAAQELRQFRDKLAGEAKKTGRKMAAVEINDTPSQNRQPGAPTANTVPPPPATPTAKEQARDRMDTPPSQEEKTRNEQLRDRIIQQRQEQKQDQQQDQQQAEQRRKEQREAARQQLERRQQQETQESQQAERRRAQQESQQRQQQEAESQQKPSRRQQQQSDDSQEPSRRQQAQQQLQQQQQQQQQEQEQRRQAAAQAAEAARQKAAEARERKEQAQQEAAQRQQQQEAARQQQQEQQRQQIQQQIQQERQERQQQRQDRRQNN